MKHLDIHCIQKIKATNKETIYCGLQDTEPEPRARFKLQAAILNEHHVYGKCTMQTGYTV